MASGAPAAFPLPLPLLANLDACISTARCYHDPQRLRADVVELFARPGIAGLQPKLGSIPGNSHTLVKLSGTVPIVYNKTQYNIPVEITLPELYPLIAPLCLVTPTVGMHDREAKPCARRQRRAVSPSVSEWKSRGTHHISSGWNARSCNLVSLVGLLSRLFSEDPPVRAVASTPSAAPQPPSQYYSAGPATSASPALAQYYTPLVAAGPHDNAVASHPALTHATSLPALPGPLPVPAATAAPSVYAPFAATGAPAPSAVTVPVGPALGPPVASPPVPVVLPAPEPELISFQKTAAADPAVLRKNLLQSLTERSQQRFVAYCAQVTAEIEQLMDENSRLRSAAESSSTDDQRHILEQKSQVQRELLQVSSLIQELNEWLRENDTGAAINADELAAPKQPEARQFYNLTAEDAALQDAFYQLEKIFNSGSMELADYIKTVRRLARDQFMIRATLKKLAERQMFKGP